MTELIVWSGRPILVDRDALDVFDAALLARLGAPADALVWLQRDLADEPWSLTVESLGTVALTQTDASAAEPTVLRAIDLPERTATALLWMRRIVEADGSVLVEDRWSRVDSRYRRLIDPDQRDARRVARYLFDGGPWGPGAPKGREKSLDEILAVVMHCRRELHRDPTQEEVQERIGYKDVRSLQRALEGTLWREVLGFASQIEAAERAHPGATLIHGFVSVAGAKTVKLSPNSVLRGR